MYDHGFKRTVTITTSDTVNITEPNEGFLVLTAGAVVAVPADGSATITFGSIAAGTYIPMKIKRINATSTTATVATVWGA